ncbi:acyl-CoA dehydrogenase family protein [Hyphomonas jannaschiana]|uniref:Acyl-CoA dehydrogenase n=1 Tax=Hyphomonas jannaschiana VP2 TaxID=1280952 RepID=A0A059FI49_9PROT|nr:acyl-CoA dehydrogenase family protein [Hyphomonas jannaschiana]KCZ90153.1 Acyl-CoA dehydrogenase [Hyphomonas jannaschiana VP2]
MPHYAPQSELETHTVSNQPKAFGDVDLFASDKALKGAVEKAGGGVHAAKLSEFGKRCGAFETQDWSRQAQENLPKLKSFDRFGHRLDEVEFHPAYHNLMSLGLDSGLSASAWNEGEAGHVLHGAMMILMNQADAGVTCPMSMTYACVPALQSTPEIADAWIPRVQASSYDPNFIPADRKTGVTIGMAMTEKQGGSDVRANTTRAVPDGQGGYILTGHKWFCSAPMSDAFLTLAYTDEGLTCFLVPRWKPDGTRNGIHVMRLKDKMGDKSNASSEIEYHGAWAERLGEEGRGVRTIIDMVQHTRYDCILGSTGGIRAALVQALWHTSQRRAFQKALIDQPAMRAVLADLVIESEAATAIAMRVGASLDRMATDEHEAAFMRLATPLAKYWVCKRQPGFVYEALECHGGAGYVEEGPMPRLYRQSPLNAIWEGSGNVIALDVLRALSREPDSLEAVQAELKKPLGRHHAYDAHVGRLADYLTPGNLHEGTARGFARDAALALQGAALHEMAPDFVFDAFCAQRLASDRNGLLYGDVSPDVDQGRLIERAIPAV